MGYHALSWCGLEGRGSSDLEGWSSWLLGLLESQYGWYCDEVVGMSHVLVELEPASWDLWDRAQLDLPGKGTDRKLINEFLNETSRF